MAFAPLKLPAVKKSWRGDTQRAPGIVAYRQFVSKYSRARREGMQCNSRRCRGLCSCTTKCQAEEATSSNTVELPTRLNNIPHQRDTRKFFYKDVTDAVLAAVKAQEKRISVRCTIPELNPEMDVFRIGTLLELCRDIATALAEDGDRVKVCVQKSMGQGVFQGLPLSLSGVRAIMDRMDWGNATDFVSFGHVAADQVDEASYYVLIAPQNVVGTTIMTPLLEMVDAAEAEGKHIILLNPLLKDIPSAAGVMQVKGRKERMEFADSFSVAYHFRLLYQSSAMMYPIMGALRRTHGNPWHAGQARKVKAVEPEVIGRPKSVWMPSPQVFKRVDVGKREEEFRVVGSFEDQPGSSKMTPLFAVQPQKPKWKRYY